MKKVFTLFLAICMLMGSFSAIAEDTPETPVVYMTKDISPAGLMAVYQALGREAAGEHVAVKISVLHGKLGQNRR